MRTFLWIAACLASFVAGVFLQDDFTTAILPALGFFCRAIAIVVTVLVSVAACGVVMWPLPLILARSFVAACERPAGEAE